MQNRLHPGCMRYIVLVLALVMIAASCSDDEQPAKKTAAETLTEEGFLQDDDTVTQGSYKMYKGEIAGQSVTVHLVMTDENIEGRYYYDKNGISIGLFGGENKKEKGTYLFKEDPPQRVNEYDYWTVNITKDSIVGTWTRAGNKNITYPINLWEHTADDMQRFAVAIITDSTRLLDSFSEPFAKTSYRLLIPVGSTAKDSFVRSMILQDKGCNGNDEATMYDCFKSTCSTYLDEYKKANADVTGTKQDLISSMYRWESSEAYNVIYNNDDILILENSGYDYTGGAHGIYGSHYLNIDRRIQKLYGLNDVVIIDSNKLIRLLEKEARKHFELGQEDDLNDRMLAEELFVSDKFYLTDKGITFVYGLYEIASYADGVIKLFIPYNKMTGLLTPAFKQRMGLEPIASTQ